jgi:hypothetical protein
MTNNMRLGSIFIQHSNAAVMNRETLNRFKMLCVWLHVACVYWLEVVSCKLRYFIFLIFDIQLLCDVLYELSNEARRSG